MLYESFCMCSKCSTATGWRAIIIKRFRERFFFSSIVLDCVVVWSFRKQVIIRSSVCIIIIIRHTILFINIFGSLPTVIIIYTAD